MKLQWKTKKSYFIPLLNKILGVKNIHYWTCQCLPWPRWLKINTQMITCCTQSPGRDSLCVQPSATCTWGATCNTIGLQNWLGEGHAFTQYSNTTGCRAFTLHTCQSTDFSLLCWTFFLLDSVTSHCAWLYFLRLSVKQQWEHLNRKKAWSVL